jgi:hypothetical protein
MRKQRRHNAETRVAQATHGHPQAFQGIPRHSKAFQGTPRPQGCGKPAAAAVASLRLWQATAKAAAGLWLVARPWQGENRPWRARTTAEMKTPVS